MNDESKTKALLIEELQELRRKVASVERAAQNGASHLEPAKAGSRLSEAQLRELTESLPHLVWTCLAEGPCDYLSRRWVEYTGIPEAEQLGYRWLEQLHPDDRDRVIAEWTATVGAEKSFDIEFRIRRADGVYRWFKTRAIPLRDESGKLVKWYGSNTDTDDYKAAIRELHEKNAQLRELNDSLPHLVWTCLAEGPCDYLSRQWVEYTGIPEAEQLDYRWLEQLHPDDRDRVIAEWKATVGAEKSFDIEFRIRRADGVYRWFKTRAIPLRDANGKLVKWYGCNTDTDDYKTAMQDLVDKRELREANERISEELRRREIAEAERAAMQEDIIAMQGARLLELSVPIIPISEGILVMPLIGAIDAERSRLVLETALKGAAEGRASYFIIDITGAKMVDSTTAALLVNTAKGLALLGARAIITGVNPQVARTFVELSLELGGFETEANVQAGLKRALSDRRRS